MSRATIAKKPRKLTKREAEKLKAKLFASLTDGSIRWPMASGPLPIEYIPAPGRIISKPGRA